VTVRVEFKFLESAPADQRKPVVEKLAMLGAKVEPLFPDEQDPELASLYKAEDVPDDAVESVVSELAAHEAVEFAERTPERKLIR
jgi:hypothetical protein